MACDLRLIAAALKINTDLERMGDLAVNIAERALSLMGEEVVPHLIDIPHIAALVQEMVRKSLDAFVSKDAALAPSVLSSDDAVDALQSAFFHELISFDGKRDVDIWGSKRCPSLTGLHFRSHNHEVKAGPHREWFPVSPFERSRKRQAGAGAVWVAEGEPRPSSEDSRGSCVPEQCGPRKG